MGTGTTTPNLTALDGSAGSDASESQLDAAIFRAGLEATRDGVTISDARLPEMPLVFVNAAFLQMSGYSRAEVLGRNCRFLQGEDRDQPAVAKIRKTLSSGKDCLVVLRNYRKNGELFHNELSLSPVRGTNGEITHFIGIQKDVTARVAREILFRERGSELKVLNKQLQQLASTDALTGLQNRRMFNLTLHREWRRLLRTKGTLSLYMIDLDNFKDLNDAHGHAAGDACLRSFGAVLSRIFCRATDYVARLGGDEFVVLAADMKSPNAIAQGERVLRAAQDLKTTGNSWQIGASIGLCSAVVHEDINEQDLLAAADTALYKAKNAGRNRLDSVEILPAGR